MTLTLVQVIKVDEGTRSTRDRRRRVDAYLAEYRGADGYEYRKRFEVAPGGAPIIPATGSNASLTALRYQGDR